MTTTTMLTDHELKDAVQRELSWTAEVECDHIGVSANDGAVTLSGQVCNLPEKAAAVQAALRVRGVSALADEIVVRYADDTLADADIAREAVAALSHNTAVVPQGSITATVHLGVITLSGTVAWQYQRAAAGHAMTVLPGVTAVANLIELAPPEPIVSGAEAEANVRAALLRNARIEAGNVGVRVVGTEIRLTGQVGTWDERHQAEFAAWCTPGVTHVVNQIVLAS